MDVGFVGLGDMGLPIAERILGAGHVLHVWARRPATLDPLRGLAIEVAGSPAELAQRTDVVFVCVQDGAGVLEVVDGLLPGLRAGAVVVVLSTTLPLTCNEAAERIAPTGAVVLDAPVSGGRPGAQAGTLSITVGGDEATFERLRPIFETFGTPRLLGPLGSGQVMKLLNNGMLGAHLRLAYDAVAIAAELGLDPRAAEQVLLQGSGGSAAIRSMIRFRELDPAHVQLMVAKDAHLFEEMARASASSELVRQLSNEAVERVAAALS